jgi:hypothetical protein
MISEGRISALERRLPPERAAMPELVVPHVVEFAVSESFLNIDLYPRQGTFLKVATCAADLFTDYDRAVLAEWKPGFKIVESDDGRAYYAGGYGTTPDVEERMAHCLASGRGMFRQIQAVIGRRGSKGYLGAILGAYPLWKAMATGDPQKHYGIARNKQIHLLVFAGQYDQAAANQWKDLRDVIIGAPCFQEFIADDAAGTLRLYSPAQVEAGNVRARDAAFVISACEATTLAGRGKAAMVQLFDEMAHLPGTGHGRSAEGIFSSAAPAMAQFRTDAVCYQASSPWHEQGAFYANYRRYLEVDPQTGKALTPDALVLQLPAHELYRDHELAANGQLAAWPGGPAFRPREAPIIDEDMYDALRRDDPEKFEVEYLAQWAASAAAYLRREDVDALFAPWKRATLQMREHGITAHSYIGHADPSLSGANFAVIVAHAESDDTGQRHVVVDHWHAWQPSDFGGRIDYEVIYEELRSLLDRFPFTQFTFDPWNSAGHRARLEAYARESPHIYSLPNIFVRPETSRYNHRTAETLKTALHRRLVHAPMHGLAHAELRALETRNGKVSHPLGGPVTTDDLVDCLKAVVDSLLGDNSGHSVHDALGSLMPHGTAFPHNKYSEAFGNAYSRPAEQPSAARGGRFHRRGRR